MRPYHFLCASAAIFLLFSCEKKEEDKPKPEPVTPKIEIPQESQAVFSQGISIESGTSTQSQTVKFTATAAWSTDVTDTKASTWLSVSPTSGGAGNVTLTVTAQPNTGKDDREASVTIKCGTVTQKFTVKQAGVPDIKVESVSLDKTELGLIIGQEATLTATVKPDDATDKTVTWSTSDASIATVTDGKITAVKEGKATITAKAGEKEATCKVTVTAKYVAVESIELDKTTLELTEGDTDTLVATVKPDDATDKSITWSSSNESIATVVDGKVTAVKEGEAIITAKAGDKEATCAVKVAKKVIEVESVTLSKTTLSLKKGEAETLTATVTPDNASEKTITWSTSNASVATVENGKVTAIKSGTATITAKAGEKSANCAVTVTTPVESISLDRTSVTLEIGQNIKLTATINPTDADEKTVTWTSSDTSVATVDGGTVKALKEGSVLITASAGEKTAECKVKVQKKVIPVTAVTLNRTTLELTKGQSETLTATVSPDDATDKTVTWSTSDASIAIVDQNGKVTAVDGGTAIIKAVCGEKSAECKVTVTVPVESITLDKTSIELKKGETANLVATIGPANADDKTVTWSSSDTEVATVDHGKVTAVKSGTAIITAKAGNKSATCNVSVTTPVTGISLDRTSLTLEEGQNTTLVATVSPNDADNKTVSWSSDKINIATVDNTGKVTAVAEGTATIKAAIGEFSATCTVTVSKKVIAVTEVTLSKTNLELVEGDESTLTATVKPDDATDKTVTWSTSNANVATVVDGKVKAVKEGTATITAKAGEKSATCAVTVSKKVVAVTEVTLNKTSLEMKENEEFTLTATVKPDDATDKTVTWSSSDKNVATVDSNGKVSAITVGKAVITATAGSKSAECTVTVTGVPNGGNEGVGYDED